MQKGQTYLVSVVVRWRNFDRGRKIEDDAVVSCSRFTSGRLDRLAHLDCKLRLRLRERLRAILELEPCTVFCRALVRQLPDELCVLHGERDGLLL